MRAILAAASILIGVIVTFLVPQSGAAAMLCCLVLAGVVGLCLSRVQNDRDFLLQVFVGGLLLRVVVGASIYYFGLQNFFGGDAFSYDFLGAMIVKVWQGDMQPSIFQGMLGAFLNRNWGMIYIVGAIYTLLGQNMLAVQFFSAVLGAATAPVIYLCAQHIFQNTRVSRLSALLVAFFPSMILWSSQGLKDGPLVFLLGVSMLATLKLAERLNVKWLAVLVVALFSIFTLRFYVFYMMVAAILGAFMMGLGSLSVKSIVSKLAVLVVVGGAMLYLGVGQSAQTQWSDYANLEAIQRSRLDLAKSGQSGFGQDIDVSTTGGALSAIPIGMLYLLFAPFPWQLASLRQSITLPEMVVWWASFPLLVMGLWFTLKYRARQALPILIFTSMLTIAYSVFQGNVGTAYRQRSQLLIFYFIFAAIGYVLVKERKEDRRQQAVAELEQAGGAQPRHAFPRQPQRAALPPLPVQQTTRRALAAQTPRTAMVSRRHAYDGARAQAAQEFRALLRAFFLSHPATTQADFERCWPELRDAVFRQHTLRALAALPVPLHVMLSNGRPGRNGGNGAGDGHGAGNGHGDADNGRGHDHGDAGDDDQNGYALSAGAANRLGE